MKDQIKKLLDALEYSLQSHLGLRMIPITKKDKEVVELYHELRAEYDSL